MFYTSKPWYKGFIPSTLVSRFLLIITIPVVTAQLIAIYIFYERHWYNILNANSRTIANEVSLITHIYETRDFASAKSQASMLLMKLRYTIKDVQQLTKNAPDSNLDILYDALTQTTKKNVSVRLVNDESEIQIIVKLSSGALIFSRSVKHLIHPTSYIFIIWMVSLTLLLLLVSLIFCRNQIKSILELANAADAFGHDRNTVLNYSPSGATEIRKAGIAFLKMKSRIEEYITKRTQTLAMISHDLKTPLTRIKLQLEMMEDSEEKIDMKSDVISMQQMIESYLDFARGEGGENFCQVKILEWLQGELNTASYKNIEISYSEDAENLEILIKPYAFKRAIDNILGNANQHASKVLISVSKKGDDAVIEIEDNGKGIPNDAKEAVFKPFYRIDMARNIQSFGSVGLGLSITREIILGHNGNISLLDGLILKGLKARIVLPIADA